MIIYFSKIHRDVISANAKTHDIESISRYELGGLKQDEIANVIVELTKKEYIITNITQDGMF